MNTKLIEDWLKKNHPNAKAKLCVKSGVSIPMIEKIFFKQYIPKRPRILWALAEALGVTEDELLQDEPIKKNRAKGQRANL